MLAVNIFSSFPYTREIRYHYSSLVLVGVILATVEAIAWVAAKRPGLVRFLVGPGGRRRRSRRRWRGGRRRSARSTTPGSGRCSRTARRARRAAVDLVPDGAPTSAIYNLLPHLAHRDEIYDFPVPWRNVNWGVDGEHLDDPARVQWIAVDRREMSAEDLTLLDRSPSTSSAVVSDRDDIVVAQRVHAPPTHAQRREPGVGQRGRSARRLDQPEVAVVTAVEHRGAAGLAVGEQEEVVAEQVHLQRRLTGVHRLGGEPLGLHDARRRRRPRSSVEDGVVESTSSTRRRRCRCRSRGGAGASGSRASP